MNKHDPDTHTEVPAAPKPGEKKQPSTSKPEGLDELADEGKGITAPAKPDRRNARE